MCGIAGFISNGNRPLQIFQDVLPEMLTAIAHRGPDGWGIVEFVREEYFSSEYPGSST